MQVRDSAQAPRACGGRERAAVVTRMYEAIGLEQEKKQVKLMQPQHKATTEQLLKQKLGEV